MLNLDMLTTGQTISLYRHMKGWTQAELAERSSLPVPNLCRIEKGRANLTLATLRRIAKSLGVKTGALADGEIPHAQFDRSTLETIAEIIVTGKRRDLDGHAKIVTNLLESLLQERLRATHRPRGTRKRLRPKTIYQNWQILKKIIQPETLKTLIERVAKHAQVI